MIIVRLKPYVDFPLKFECEGKIYFVPRNQNVSVPNSAESSFGEYFTILQRIEDPKVEDEGSIKKRIEDFKKSLPNIKEFEDQFKATVKTEEKDFLIKEDVPEAIKPKKKSYYKRKSALLSAVQNKTEEK